MARSICLHKHTLRIGQILTVWLYPRLRELPPAERKPVLDKARNIDFDVAEWVGIVGGCAFVAWLLRFDYAALPSQMLMVIPVLQFVLALPLLGIVVGPFYVRRTRRGLDRELDQRKRCARNANNHSIGRET